MAADRVLFVRHGQTEHNAQGRVQGQIDIELNETGRAQASAVAAAIAGYLGDRRARVVSSDLSRAFQTAEAIASTCGLEVETDERLRERAFGRFEGLSSDELNEQYPKEYELWRAGGTPEGIGIEDKLEVGKRMSRCVQEFVAEGTEGTTLVVVSHGSAITQTLREMLGIRESTQPVFRGMDNCHFTEIESGRFHGEQGWRLRMHNMGAP